MTKNSALIILDGVGISPERRGNALTLAKKPYLDELFKTYPKALLKASGQEVGLPWGEVGNSEVGHSSIGLGRVILQDLPQIDKAVIEGNLANRKVIKAAAEVSNDLNSYIHLIGLASDGGVHAHIKHLIALYKIFKLRAPNERIYFHIIADGRDSQEKSVQKYIDQIRMELGSQIQFASLSGRFYAMDRDKNWDRIEKAYQVIIGHGAVNQTIDEAIKNAYERGETDEFITPVCLKKCPKANMDYDIFVFANYRSDRAVQLTRSFVDVGITEIKKIGIAKNFITMTTYSEDLHVKVLFSNIELDNPKTNPLTNPFSKIISVNNLTQAHIAESEKFAHVTYFYAGGIEKPFKGEKDILIKSMKLQSYDKYPQMKAREISNEIIQNAKNKTNFILANFANGDMVGHSGNLDASIKAIEILDRILSKTIPPLLENDYNVFLTADHGNCDEMIDLKSGKPNKEHSLNPIPFLFINKNLSSSAVSYEEFASSEPIGVLADITPTILDTMEINKSPEMTGVNLGKSLI